MDSFNKLVSETSYLYKYGFLTEKLSLPDSIKNHINDFFSSVFAFTPTNSQITQQHINLFNIFDFNINELKTFFLEKFPYIFLTHSLDTFIFHFDLFQYFSISKEEMLQFIKKTFSEIKNEHYFDVFFDFNRKEPLFQSWIKSIVSENEPELFIKESEKIYLYFWNNSNDCPELRVYLLKINLFLKIFSYDMDNILSKSKNIIKKDFPNSIYTQENDTKSSNFTNYFLFYSYIFTEKLKISQSEFENILSSIDIKYKTFYHDNPKNYVKSSYFFYLTLMDHMHYNQGATASHNFFFAPILFRNTIINFYSNLNFSHFLFQKRFNLILPHEQNNSSIFTLTTHLQHSVDIQKMLFNFQLNISRISTSDLSINSVDKSYEDLNGFFNFLFECILAQSVDGGHQTITDTLEFIVFNLRLVDFLPKVYNAYTYSNFICTSLSIDYAKELRKQNLFTIVTDSSPTKPIKVKKKI